MALTRTTEVRRISRPDFINIAKILDQPSTNPAWKKLMQIVPREMTHAEDLSDDGPKYTFHHIRLIEDAVTRLRQPAAQIFLDEWITCGRIRPTLSHLLQLLIKSELFRAADYVATKLLKESPPQRPSKGPAARIDITLPEDDAEDALNVNRTYPTSSEMMNLNNHDVRGKEIPNKEFFDRALMADASMSEEDLIRFSTTEGNNNATPQSTPSGRATFPEAPPQGNDSSSIRVPNINQLFPNSSLHQPEASTSSSTTKQSDNSHQSGQQVESSQSDSTDSGASHSAVVPNLSKFMQFGDSINSNCYDDNFPNLSALNVCPDAGSQHLTEEQECSEFMPKLSALMIQSQ